MFNQSPLGDIPHDCIIDGEIVCLDAEGRSCRHGGLAATTANCWSGSTDVLGQHNVTLAVVELRKEESPMVRGQAEA
jgi:hypothetical protein